MDLLYKGRENQDGLAIQGERKPRWICYTRGKITKMDLLYKGRENQDGLARQRERKLTWTCYTSGRES